VWSALYLMIAIAGSCVWRRGGAEARLARTVYAVQPALNLSWSLVFFGTRLIAPALAVIGALLVPCAGRVSFAAVLNAPVWRLN
jgi:tryptophan-rich sensory protein